MSYKLSDLQHIGCDIICDNLEQRAKVISILEKAGISNADDRVDNYELVVCLESDGTYTTFLIPDPFFTPITATNFINHNQE